MAAANFGISKLAVYQPQLAHAESLQKPPPTPPQAAVAASIMAQPDSALQNLLNQWATSHSSQKWALVVQGLSGNSRSASLNPNTVFDSASTYKLLLTYPLLQTIPQANWSSTNIRAGGKTMTINDCVTLMIRVSDNACGEALGKRVGWVKTDRLLRQIGLTGTNLSHTGSARTSPADVTYFLRGLYETKFFDEVSKNTILNLMRQQVFRKGIPAGCPTCTVADKIGDLGYVRHDAGIVEYNSGAYILVIFTSGASYDQIAQLTSQIQSLMSQPAP